MADLTAIVSVKGHDQESLRSAFMHLSAAGRQFQDVDGECDLVGGVVADAKIDWINSGLESDLHMHWHVSKVSHWVARCSNRWTLIDKGTTLPSRFAVAPFQHLSGRVRLGWH